MMSDFTHYENLWVRPCCCEWPYSVHVAANGPILFFHMDETPCVYVLCLPRLLSVDSRLLPCPVTSNAAVSTEAQASFLWRYTYTCPGVALQDHMVGLFLIF